MSKPLQQGQKTMGTFPVFMTAVSTILGAILFLKFGYSVGNVGLVTTMVIIIVGHLVTIPTAMSVAEIATNQKVEGGGAYYIISRSFGLNVGGAIGIALYLAQAISISFYIFAFSEAVIELLRIFNHELQAVGLDYTMFPTELLNLATMGILTALILTKGANVGIKALYFVVAVIVIALFFFFIGKTDYKPTNVLITDHIANGDDFFVVLSIIFPAFTGIAAGLGLSGDLKEPRRSIPRGTLWATLVGLIVYFAVAIKLFVSAPLDDLANNQMIMAQIAGNDFGIFIPIGLACAAISSALGSILIAPRTLQALGVDHIFPGNINEWLGKGKGKRNEPFNGSLITIVLAVAFLFMGDLESIAQIITMFFMVTYGAICLVSFLEHIGADPSYRPTFKSRWYIALGGAALSFWLMFKIDSVFAITAIALMVGFYIWISNTKKDHRGMANLFKSVMFQLTRGIQVFLQRQDRKTPETSYWRPFLMTVSTNSFERFNALTMTSWISFKYGFGNYTHLLIGDLSKENLAESEDAKARLIDLAGGIKNRVFLDTYLASSEEEAIRYSVQTPSSSGQDNNMVLFEFEDGKLSEMDFFKSQYQVLKDSKMDIAILKSSLKGFGYHKNIHIWIDTTDFVNSNLMILLGYIILGHPDWRKAEIKIYSLQPAKSAVNRREELLQLIKTGRLPISSNNIEIITIDSTESHKTVIEEHSQDADLTIIGFNHNHIEKYGNEIFDGYHQLGNVLFVNAAEFKEIE